MMWYHISMKNVLLMAACLTYSGIAFGQITSPTQQRTQTQTNPFLQQQSGFNTQTGIGTTQTGTYNGITTQQPWQQQGQGNGFGASYYNPTTTGSTPTWYNNSYQNNGTTGYQTGVQNTGTNNYQTGTTGYQNSATTTSQPSNDLLWLFTGSTNNFSTQMHSGFQSNGTTTFWNRLWGILASVAYNRVGSRLVNSLGSLEGRVTNAASGILNYQPGTAQGYCYQCMLNRGTSLNPTNTNAISPGIFNGPVSGTSSSIPSTSSSSAGGIH